MVVICQITTFLFYFKLFTKITNNNNSNNFKSDIYFYQTDHKGQPKNWTIGIQKYDFDYGYLSKKTKKEKNLFLIEMDCGI